MKMTDFVLGSCEDYCPQLEIKLRTKEKLLHFYEYKNGQKNVSGILVKSFSRSAAGAKNPKPEHLRTESCLYRTIQYLLKDIILDKRKPFNFAYDFIFDRLRAVRQEIVMQNYNAKQTIKLLEPMIMFLAYSRYKLCEAEMDTFDPKICDQHLQECLKRVLCCYDELFATKLTKEPSLCELRNRNFIEALYQIFNLGSIEALNRAVQLPTAVKLDETFKTAFIIALSYYQGNLYRVLCGIVDLPHLLCATATLKLQTIRRKLLQVFAHAYNSKHLVVQAEYLCTLTKHHNVQDLRDDCKHYNLKTSKDACNVYFIKDDFNLNAPLIKVRHEYFVEEKFKNVYLPDMLLLRKI